MQIVAQRKGKLPQLFVPAAQFRAMRKWWRDSLRIMWVESALKKIQLGLNTLRVYLFFDNLIGPRRSEPGAMHYARRRLAQVGVCAGGCAELVTRGSRASTHPTAPVTVANRRTRRGSN